MLLLQAAVFACVDGRGPGHAHASDSAARADSVVDAVTTADSVPESTAESVSDSVPTPYRPVAVCTAEPLVVEAPVTTIS